VKVDDLLGARGKLRRVRDQWVRRFERVWHAKCFREQRTQGDRTEGETGALQEVAPVDLGNMVLQRIHESAFGDCLIEVEDCGGHAIPGREFGGICSSRTHFLQKLLRIGFALRGIHLLLKQVY
jgi:hypothetical protein